MANCRSKSDAEERDVFLGSILFALNPEISIKHSDNKNLPDTLQLEIDRSKYLWQKNPLGLNGLMFARKPRRYLFLMTWYICASIQCCLIILKYSRDIPGCGFRQYKPNNLVCYIHLYVPVVTSSWRSLSVLGYTVILVDGRPKRSPSWRLSPTLTHWNSHAYLFPGA